MNFFKRLFGGRRHRPESKAAAAKSVPTAEPIPKASEEPSAGELIGPPEGHSPIVMVEQGKTMMIIDRLSYEYREGLTRGTDPTQAELDQVLAKVSRLRVLAGGMMRDKALGVEVLLDTRNAAEISAFRAALRIEENRQSFTHCACLGGPTVECYAGRTVAATLSFHFHHGHGVRWHCWKHDARLADPEPLLQWFSRHKIEADPGKSSEDPMQLHLLAMADAERLAYRAQSHLMRGEIHQALEDCSQAFAVDPKCALAYGVRALVYHTQQRAEECEADCDAAIRLGLKHPRVFYTRAVARHARKELNDAEADCNAALALAPEHAGVYNSRGLVRGELGRIDEALADFTKAIELAPRWLVPRAHRAGLHEYTEALPRAIEDYTAAITIIEESSAENPEAAARLDGYRPSFYYVRRGCSFWGLGELDTAESDFDRAVELDPEDPQTLLSRAGFAFTTGQCETAIWDCTEAIRLRPDLVEGYLARARIRMSLNDLDEALDDLNEAIRWSPDSPDAFLLRGQLFLQMTRDDDALRDFGTLIQLGPEHPLGYYMRSYCWRKRRDHARQRDDLEQVVRLAPDWSEPCNSLAWLLATCPDASFHDGPRAVELARRALEHSSEPTRAECLDTLAAALAQIGEFAAAIDQAIEAISLMDDIDRRLNYQRRLSLYENGEPYREEPDD